MMNFVRPGSIFLNPGLQYRACPDASPCSATKPRLPNAWKNIDWSTNVESDKPDGQFGPAKQMWGDCWFMASLAAVTNDKDGRKQLAESIKKTWNGYRVTFAGSPT